MQSTLLIIGALALMLLQAIDINFRLMDYLPGFIVAAPMIIALLILPVWSTHRKIVAEKNREMAKVQVMLDATAQDASEIYESTAKISMLLGYKQQLQALPTWPADLPDIYRLSFYLIIPPLSWTGSALIQRWLA